MQKIEEINRNLFICYTPFHCIVSLLLQITYFGNEESELIVVSTMNGFEKVGKGIEDTGIFTKVHYVDMKKLQGKYKYAKATFFPRYFLKKIDFMKKKYSHIFSNNLYGDLENAIYYFNRKAEISMFDEGYSTYTSDFLYAINKFSIGHKLVRKFSKFFLRRNYIDKNIKDIYLFDPDLCIQNIPYEIKKISIENDELNIRFLKLIKEIFNTERAKDEYQEEYVFFEESFAEDFNKNGDLEIIEKIASIVGKENLLIKLHPRDTTNRFIKLGYKTNKTFSVPWEAIALTMENPPLICITFSSGAALNYRFLSKKNSKTILLYKLMPDNFIQMTDEQLEWFAMYIKKYGQEIYAPKSMDELRTYLLDKRG